ncbi:crotonase/enoyl-CoA hydratase family protein [Candidatus Frankia alpina]|uniref:Crotonase/enoyl-CoA hydratase family protein n=1 Tax=Candidatus Frankia alpina TaxID=2699483 RepID=A0A4S5EQ99_9ACTN|nr:crotonase/enoyl-CoA hydratase family protein [Candidatus Frankia alpina]THJ74303.1 crotonase/enoyl-CoA hydratase family protein [Candidatus Frankia alpina]
MSDEVLVEHADGVTVITINRPQARNAVNRAVSEGVAAALDEFESRKDLTVAIITGAGGTFCSGMDLKAFLRGENVVVEGRGLAGITLTPPRKPIIAAVEGFALAGGCEVVLSCDLVVAAENAAFGIPEVKRSLVAGAGGLLRLPKRIPYQVAMELALTGDQLSAVDAHRYGLVNVLTPAGEALAGARALAARIAANGPLAVAATKEILASASSWPADEAFDRQAEIMNPVFASADAKEGALAFAEKRAPVWRGE